MYIRRMTRRILYSIALLAGWTLPGLLGAVVQLALFPNTAILRDNLWLFTASTSVAWWSWAVVTPLIVMASRRYRFERGDVARSVVTHLALALDCCGLYTVWYAWSVNYIRPASVTMRDEPFMQLVRGYVVSRLVIGLITYATVAVITIAIGERARRRERELEAARLEADLAQAQLRTLQMQLQPHFLFNTLHAISMLVQQNPAAASRMIAQL